MAGGSVQVVATGPGPALSSRLWRPHRHDVGDQDVGREAGGHHFLSSRLLTVKRNIGEMGEEIEVGDRPSSMTERLSAEAALIGGGEPKHDGFVMRDACAMCGQLWDW